MANQFEISLNIEIPGLEIQTFNLAEDLEPISRVIEKCDRTHEIKRKITAQDLKLWLTYLPNFDWLKDMLVLRSDGEVIGWLVWHWIDTGDGERIYRHVADVSPEWERKKVGTALLRYSEAKILEIEANTSHGLTPCIDVGAFDTETGKIALLEHSGYAPYRFFVSMIRDLAEEIPTLNLPRGLEVRTAVEKDYRKIWEASDEAFQDHWGHRPGTEEDYRWFLESRHFQPDLWKVAWEGDQVAGMVLNFIDHEENQAYSRLRGYTEDISVIRPWRRRGLARALLAQSLQMMKSLGMQEAALLVDTQNPHDAFGLYSGVGFQKEQRQVVYRKNLA